MSLADETMRARCVADLDAMNVLIADALAYARGSDVALEHQSLDLADIAATEIAEREAVGAGLPIEACLADARILGDRAALRRVVANLLDNATRYGRSRLRVTVALAGGRAHLVVEDDGPGIPPAERSAVVLPFYRVEASRNRETAGTGLGLAIAARIVEAHGGGISFDASPWGGALVRVSIPAHGLGHPS